MAHATRTLEHHSATGRNAHFVIQNKYDSGFRESKVVTFSARKGRGDIGEAVQIELTIETRYEKTTRRQDTSLTFDAETWAALVEFVREDREVPRPTMQERLANCKRGEAV